MVKPSRSGTSEAIAELRRISGLTWEQLAGMLQVSRRALHFWASDKQMHPAHEERVHRVLAALRRIDRGAPDLTRAALLENGAEALDRLGAGDFAGLEKLLSAGSTAPRRPPQVPRQAMAERRPPSPADLVQSSQDGPHPATLGGSRVRSMKATRIPRGK
jgi:transcriptional regulator with XRE-family HTH domain